MSIDYEAEGLVSPERAAELLDTSTDGDWSVVFNDFDRKWGVASVGGIDGDFGTTWVASDEQTMNADDSPPNAPIIAAAPAMARTIERQAEELAKAEERGKAARDAIRNLIDVDPRRGYGICSECGLPDGHEPECAWATAARLVGWLE